MRTVLIALGVLAAVLILLGILVKAAKWLIVIGLAALVVAIVAGFLQVRRAVD